MNFSLPANRRSFSDKNAKFPTRFEFEKLSRILIFKFSQNSLKKYMVNFSENFQNFQVPPNKIHPRLIQTEHPTKKYKIFEEKDFSFYGRTSEETLGWTAETAEKYSASLAKESFYFPSTSWKFCGNMEEEKEEEKETEEDEVVFVKLPKRPSKKPPENVPRKQANLGATLNVPVNPVPTTTAPVAKKSLPTTTVPSSTVVLTTTNVPKTKKAKAKVESEQSESSESSKNVGDIDSDDSDLDEDSADKETNSELKVASNILYENLKRKFLGKPNKFKLFCKSINVDDKMFPNMKFEPKLQAIVMILLQNKQ
jgi:hypothetical protein